MYLIIARLKNFFWNILLIFIFLRPFLSEYAFLKLGFWYISFFIITSLIYIIFIKGINLIQLPLNLSVSIFLIVILISLFLRTLSFWGIYEFYLFIPNFIIFYIIGKIDTSQRKQILNVIFVSAILIGIYTVYQYLAGLRHVLNYIIQKAISFRSTTYIREVLVGRRVFATFISPNLFASYLVMVLFFGLGSLFCSTKRKIIYVLATVLSGLALLYTKSIGAILTFVMIFILWFSLTVPQIRFKNIFYKRATIVMISILFFIILLYLSVTRQRISSFFDFKYTHNSILQRLYYWQAALRMIKEYPFWGIGWRNFGIFYYFYKLPQANISHYAHNVFLQITAELGALGFLSFLTIVYAFLRIGIKILKKNSSDYILKLSIFLAGVAFLVNNLVDLSFYFSQVAFFWWMILGLMNSYLKSS